MDILKMINPVQLTSHKYELLNRRRW